MKNTLILIKKHLALVSGVGLFVYGFFNFDSSTYCESQDLLSLNFGCKNPVTYYYYTDGVIALLVIGAILLTLGILSAQNNSESV